ncbi:MAG: hypothetical protein KKA62_02680 [Nanoarchaeota archaeon]|nr:hypothetical protein [Nanoarchaeota archaeon]MBU1644543.1 hypothetical protein [Nanoarchaeota archaeon]MBU1976836.1 hypothetical protein [Nanoarchaeota archaeon]
MEDFIIRKEDLEIPEEEEKPSKLKKLFILMAGVIMIVLMLSFIFASYPLSNIIAGLLESSPLDSNEIKMDGFSIIFEDLTHESLKQIYFSEQKVEFSVCLQGQKVGPDYYIGSLYLPEMYEQAFDHVSFQPCSKDTLIMLHSHPYKSCLASDTDLDTLKKNKEVNPDVLMVIMCEPERFSVYGAD